MATLQEELLRVGLVDEREYALELTVQQFPATLRPVLKKLLSLRHIREDYPDPSDLVAHARHHWERTLTTFDVPLLQGLQHELEEFYELQKEIARDVGQNIL